jgi:hypothetical protein
MSNSEFEAKKARALEILKATGIRRNNYEPPAVTLLWKMGLKVPPPHFASFIASALFAAVFFGVTWGLFMWFFVWSGDGMQVETAILTSAVSGTLFGSLMGIYYAYGRRKYQLPDWKTL